MNTKIVAWIVACALSACAFGADAVSLSTSGALFRFRLPYGGIFEVDGPSFEVNGKVVAPVFSSVVKSGEKNLPNEIKETEYKALYRDNPSLTLSIITRTSKKSPVVRLRYVLGARGEYRLTKSLGSDQISYLSFSAKNAKTTEVRLSVWNKLMHSFMPSERVVDEGDFGASLTAMGPIITVERDGMAALVAYEHGSTYPDCYLKYAFSPDGRITLKAAKANYLDGRLLSDRPFESIWFDLCFTEGTADHLAQTFRSFLLNGISTCEAGRIQRLCYNTWGWQERSKWTRKNGGFFDFFNEECILREIDAAHACGIEVFVIDDGLFRNPGDWIVRKELFPNSLKKIRERIESYGMRLGAWVGGVTIGVKSEAYKRDPSVKVISCGEEWPCGSSERGFIACLASGFWREMADALIRLRKECGVSYFKVDGVGQYLCESALHGHGTADLTSNDRLDCYGFELVRSLCRMAERVQEACPDVVMDFDVTEPGRCFGLGLLASWRFFLINNGPYYADFNAENPANGWNNVFVFPGPARAALIRKAAAFDKWIPLSLLLTHGLIDMPKTSIDVNFATAILGFGGLWGNVAAVPEEGRSRYKELAHHYRAVREDAITSAAVVTGTPGEGYEIHEKISNETGRGYICLFSSCVKRFPAREFLPIPNEPLRYLTKKKVGAKVWASQSNVKITRQSDGRLLIEADFKENDAIIVFCDQ